MAIELTDRLALKSGINDVLIDFAELVKMGMPIPCSDLTARDAIASSLRIADKTMARIGTTTYALVGGTANANWQDISSGTVDPAVLTAEVSTQVAPVAKKASWGSLISNGVSYACIDINTTTLKLEVKANCVYTSAQYRFAATATTLDLPNAGGSTTFFLSINPTTQAFRMDQYNLSIPTTNELIMCGRFTSAEQISTLTAYTINSKSPYTGNVTDGTIVSIADKVRSAQTGNTLTFVYATDFHAGRDQVMPLDRCARHGKKVCDVASLVAPDFIMLGGDNIQGDGSYSTYTDLKCQRALMEDMLQTPYPLMSTIGSHDFGIGATLTNDQMCMVYGRFFKHLTPVYNSSDTYKTYYYIDMPLQKVRVINLNTNDAGVDRKTYGFSTTQTTWFSTILGTVPSGWKVVVFSHMATRTELMSTSQVESGNLVEAALSSYIAGGGTVLAYIHAHVHWDNIHVLGSGLTYPNICTVNSYPADEYAVDKTGMTTLGTPTSYTRGYGTLIEYAIDTFVINVDTGEIDIFRYGCGSDRNYTPA